MKRSFFMLMLLTVQWVLVAQSLNIGNLTAVRVKNDKIFVAGQQGVALLNADKSVVWQVTLDEASVRLCEVCDNGIVCSSYAYEGKKGQLLSGFSSLWDKVFYTGQTVCMLDNQGNVKWSTPLAGKSKLSAPAVSGDLIAVAGNDSLLTLDAKTGMVKSRVYCNEKFLLGKQIKDHATPNKPLITADAIYNAAAFKLTKSDFNGKILESKEQFGAFQALPVMTVSPVLVDNLVCFGNSAIGQRNTKDGTSRLYCVDSKLNKKWDEFVDVNGQTGISSLVKAGSVLYLATNGSVLAFSSKGKKLWEFNKKIGVPDLRGVRYPGMGSNLAVKVSSGNFLCATDSKVYLASGMKVKKNWVNQILILDAKKGKPIGTTDLKSTVVDMDLLGEKLIVITEQNELIVL